MNSNSTAPTPPIRLMRIAGIVAVLVIIGLIIGFVPRRINRHKLLEEMHADSIPTVDVILPAASESNLGTPLPAEVQPFMQASIHAQASGYLKNWFVDIGDQVTKGQILAEIDTPELDRQLVQARAELDKAKASLDLAKITADRWTELLNISGVSKQEAAGKKADYAVKKADVEAVRANLQQLEELKKFSRVTAPFSGTITSRNTDIGQLISANNGTEFRVILFFEQ